ncbi:MAG: nicotinate (nicotinamide) nucleotide adenylyltransferase [Bdellovibrionales bacterium]|nr:nicotinate (nicotinamide) nucleotide adenylyltransferase [Bdellovibrionales bacterium]
MDTLNKNNFKIGVFGSSFNPLHLGHLNLLTQVQENFEFDLIKVIPNWQSPLASRFPEVSPQKRLALLRKVLKDYPFVEVDDQEIKRKGVSYTIDTIKAMEKEEVSNKELFLIIGLDQLMQFDKWKDFKTLIEKAHLIVCSRGGYEWSPSLLPSALRKGKEEGGKRDSDFFLHESLFQKKQIKYKAHLKSGKSIYYLTLNDMDIASSQIRQRIRQGEAIAHLVPPAVNQWIRKNNLYEAPPFPKKAQDIPGLIKFCVRTLLDKKARKIKTFDLRSSSSLPFDFTLVVSGLNTRHTKVMADFLRRQVKKEFSVFADQMEGQASGEWIVLDYGALVVHIFYDYTREYYRLEDLWKEAMVQDFLV